MDEQMNEEGLSEEALTALADDDSGEEEEIEEGVDPDEEDAPEFLTTGEEEDGF